MIGAIPGEGIGSEIVSAAVEAVAAVAEVSEIELEIRTGGPIGKEAEREIGSVLPDEAIEFCDGIFAEGGAVLCGPGGGRFVYDIRRRFDLFFKISPLRTVNGLPECSRLDLGRLGQIDILLVRENSGGIYQGSWSETGGDDSLLSAAEHRFGYVDAQVDRFLESAARLAQARRGGLAVVWKESGVPSVSRLWRERLERITSATGIAARLVDVDLMAYLLISEPESFDVVAAPNLFGDVLGDLGAFLLGSRGVSYSGNFSHEGWGVYQTNHGAAYDLAGTQTANPAGQILSAAMMLRESFGMWREAAAIERGLQAAWREGWRTRDVATPGTRVSGTAEMAAAVCEKAAEFARAADRG